MTPDDRYLEDQECWPHWRPKRAEPVSEPVAPNITYMEDASPEPIDASHAAAQEAGATILRRIERLRCARDAINQEIADHDRALDELNGGEW